MRCCVKIILSTPFLEVECGEWKEDSLPVVGWQLPVVGCRLAVVWCRCRLGKVKSVDNSGRRVKACIGCPLPVSGWQLLVGKKGRVDYCVVGARHSLAPRCPLAVAGLECSSGEWKGNSFASRNQETRKPGNQATRNPETQKLRNPETRNSETKNPKTPSLIHPIKIQILEIKTKIYIRGDAFHFKVLGFAGFIHVKNCKGIGIHVLVFPLYSKGVVFI